MLSQTSVPDPAVVEPEMVDVAGSPVALRRKGRGNPLIFLHGFGFTGRWLRFHEELAGEADVIAPEHIGFGDTPAQDWVRDITDMAVHYDDLANTLGVDRFDLVGYSLGGWIAAKYASLFPKRVRSLTLLVPDGIRLPGSTANSDMFLYSPEQLMAALFHDPTNIAEAMQQPDGVDPVDAQMKMYDQFGSGARLVWNPRHDRKLGRQLRRVASPVLLIGAEHDELLRPENTIDSYARLLPDARTEIIPNTGHGLIIEQPAKVAKAIHDFLGENR